MSGEVEAMVPKRRGRPPKNVELGSESVARSYPEAIVMTRPFGYLDVNGQGHMWQPKMMVTDAGEIADIINRGCKDWT